MNWKHPHPRGLGKRPRSTERKTGGRAPLREPYSIKHTTGYLLKERDRAVLLLTLEDTSQIDRPCTERLETFDGTVPVPFPALKRNGQDASFTLEVVCILGEGHSHFHENKRLVTGEITKVSGGKNRPPSADLQFKGAVQLNFCRVHLGVAAEANLVGAKETSRAFYGHSNDNAVRAARLEELWSQFSVEGECQLQPKDFETAQSGVGAAAGLG